MVTLHVFRSYPVMTIFKILITHQTELSGNWYFQQAFLYSFYVALNQSPFLHKKGHLIFTVFLLPWIPTHIHSVLSCILYVFCFFSQSYVHTKQNWAGWTGPHVMQHYSLPGYFHMPLVGSESALFGHHYRHHHCHHHYHHNIRKEIRSSSHRQRKRDTYLQRRAIFERKQAARVSLTVYPKRLKEETKYRKGFQKGRRWRQDSERRNGNIWKINIQSEKKNGKKEKGWERKVLRIGSR